MNTNELWQAVLGELELSLGRANFTTWFRSTFIISYDAGQLCIGVPNLFTKAWLEKKYHKEIYQSLQTHTGNGIRVICYKVEAKAGAAQQIPERNVEVVVVAEPRPQAAEPVMRPVFVNPVVSSTVYQQDPEPVVNKDFGEFSLNRKYTFGNFVVGKQNELAHAAAQAVVTQPGGVYNPLFIYGGVGLGKTHLLQAVGNEIIRKNSQAKVLYVTSEKFTNDFINAVRTGHAKEFKNQYRNVDVLLIDDIQFITSKEQTQEEFFNTFNQLYQTNKQIVISSDRPPNAIIGLEPRLQSRLLQGMITDVGAPDFETRVAILDTKCREKSFPLDRDILHHMATLVQSNVRELEGALNKVIAFHQFKNQTPTVESVRPILSSFQPNSAKKSVTPRQLIQIVATYFDLQIPDLLGKSREKRLAFPRQITMYLMREEMKSSYPSIGTELGGRDHTTAMHAYDKISGIVTEDEKLQHDLELIKQRLYAL
ncbi:MAG: chromosomal replication initiator protein DnaA [Candidatus Uhrbacteria bacterium]